MPIRRDSLKTLSTITQILQKSHPSENPLAHIVTMVREQMNVDVCSLYLLQGDVLILVATNGLDPASIGKVRMKVHEGLTGLAVEKLQPVIVNEASLHPRFKYFAETGEENFHSFAAVPLLDRDRVVGVLTIQTRLPRDFESQEIDLLKLIAFSLSGVIHNLVTLEISRELSKDEKEGEKKSVRFKGTPVAPGFGIGAAFILKAGVTPVIVPMGSSEKHDASKEWKNLSMAIRKASADLLKLEKKLQKKFSKKESDIFYSHRMILSDKSFLKKLKSCLDKKSAVDAVTEVIGEYIEHFEKVEDPHFRERAADLEDLRQRVLDHLFEKAPRHEKESWEGILIAETLVPSDTTRLDPERIRGIITVRGGVTSHASILARTLGIPAVMGVSGALKIQPGELVIVDGNTGAIYAHPEPSILKEYEKIQEQYADQIVQLQKISDEPALTKDGHRIHLEANVGLISGIKQLKELGAEGIGLYRTELPFMVRKKLPDEEEQFTIYRQVVEELQGLPVTFRLLDAGGDKPIEALGLQKEANPFLGYRSIRFSLSQPEILRVQLRALLRVSTLGPIRILVPMISGIEEIREVKQIIEETKKEMMARGQSFDPKIPVGIMIEVPAAVLLADLLIQECDFFSIGTNDLIQYTLAVDRNNEQVSQFYEPLHPAVLSSLSRVVRIAREAGKSVSVCGEMAGDPLMAALFIGFGVTHLSMIPSNIPRVKQALLQIEMVKAKIMAEKIVRAATIQEARALLQ